MHAQLRKRMCACTCICVYQHDGYDVCACMAYLVNVLCYVMLCRSVWGTGQRTADSSHQYLLTWKH